MISGFMLAVLVLLGLALVTVFMGVKVVPQGREYTVERFGRYTRTLTPGPALHHALRRGDRRAAEHDGAGARCALAGGDHQGQRDGHGRRRGVLPDPRGRQGGLRGQRARARDPQPDDDQPAHGDGLDGPRRAALAARPDQRAAAAHGRRRDHALGRQGDAHRDQGHRAADRPRRFDGPPDEGRARQARLDPRGRGPAAGRDPQGRGREAVRRSSRPRAARRRRSATPRRASARPRPRPRRPRC